MLTAWWRGVRTTPRHSAADAPALTLVKSPRYEINTNARAQFWRAESNGNGWCVVVNRPGSPATGNPALCDGMNERYARHVADLHNNWLDRQVRHL